MPSYEKRKGSGLWSVRFRETQIDGPAKNKRLSGFKTKKEAQYAYEDYIKTADERQALTSNSLELNEDTPFAELAERFLDFKKQRNKETSFYDINKNYRKRILPFFENYKIAEITPALILEWQKTIEEFSYNFKKSLFSLLSSTFSFAAKYYDIKNPMPKVDRPRNLEKKKEMLFYTPEEFEKLYSCFAKEEYAFFFLFLFISGCRRGEALALEYNDFNTDKKSVEISKSCSKKKGAGDKAYIITTPKNKGSNRTIYLPSIIFDELKKHKKRENEKGAIGKFVFGGEDPFPMSSLKRALDNAADAAEVKRIRIHDFRHSCASFLIHKGITIVAVSRHLGHTNVEQTLNTYAHMLPNDHEALISALETAVPSLKK